MRYKDTFFLAILAIFVLVLAGCQNNRSQERGMSSDSASSTSGEEEFEENESEEDWEDDAPAADTVGDFGLWADVVSPIKVKLGWKSIPDGDAYVITRRKANSKSKLFETLAVLPTSQTSYVDETVEAGKKYEYTIMTNCVDQETQQQMDPEHPSYWIEQDTIPVYTYMREIYFDSSYHGGWKFSPDKISLIYLYRDDIKIDDDAVYWLEDTGVEIFRGESRDTCVKYDEINYEDEDFDDYDYDAMEEYRDTEVEYGKTYYYRIRGFAERDGKRYYGKLSEPVRLSAVKRRGEYNVKLLTKNTEKTKVTKGTDTLRLVLKGKDEGNARLELSQVSMKYLVEYIYSADNGTVDSMTLRLNRYRKKGGKWRTYQGERISIQRKEKIVLELTAKDRGTGIPYPRKKMNQSNIIFSGKYNNRWYHLTCDPVKGKVTMDRDNW